MNKHTVKYFDSNGIEIDATHALDRNGVLKDRCTMRVPTTMRDAMRTRDAQPEFTDGHSMIDPAAGLKPGWRMPVVQDRRAVLDAYQRYQTELTNAYRCNDGEVQCTKCIGSGEINGANCNACNGEGVTDEDDRKEGKSLFGSGSGNGHGRSDASRQDKDQAYRAYDHDLQNAWRGR